MVSLSNPNAAQVEERVRIVEFILAVFHPWPYIGFIVHPEALATVQCRFESEDIAPPKMAKSRLCSI
jgi:hypothetical protein